MKLTLTLLTALLPGPLVANARLFVSSAIALSCLVIPVAAAEDFTRWQPMPARSAPVSVGPQAATMQAGEWSYLVAPAVFANVEVTASVTIDSPASQFDFFGSSWSAWPDPKFADRGFEAGLLLRHSEDGFSGYRVQFSSKYQEVALVRFPDGGYVRSVPCEIKTQTPIKLQVKAAGSVLRVFLNDPLFQAEEVRLPLNSSPQ